MEKISRPAAARFLGRKIQREKILPTVLILLVMLLFLIPIFIAVLTAFKTKLEIAESVLAFPKALRFDNFAEGLKKKQHVRFPQEQLHHHISVGGADRDLFVNVRLQHCPLWPKAQANQDDGHSLSGVDDDPVSDPDDPNL